MSGGLELVLPGERFEPSFREAFGEQGNPLAESFSALLEKLAERRANIVPPGMVGETTLWLVEGGTYLGRISIRHALNDRLRAFGGHIGYDIRPSRRGEGLGSKMLSLALPHARALGIDPAMLTCDVANVASWRTIERNRGVREAAYEHEGITCLRYWIPTT